MADKKNLTLLFERPNEPVFLQKGKNDVVFEVPENFVTERYRGIVPLVTNRFGGDRIVVNNISIPNLKVPESLGRDEPFSLFLPFHRRIAGHLINIFMGLRSVDDLQSVAVYARDRLNPLLFNYALSVAMLHRPDTKDVPLPRLFESFPDKFVDSRVLQKVREEATIVTEGNRIPIIIPKDYTASDLDPEHRLWYFREDLGINLHHWHWHLVYPYEGNRQIVEKDRRGEVFYYMHQQIQGRYNIERFCNGLSRVVRYNNFRDPIAEAYFPKMDSLVASRAWPARVANSVPRDVDRENDQVKIDINDMDRYADKIIEACRQGFVVDPAGNRIPLDERTGIDILGNVVESSILSPNPQLYGDWHNMGHTVLSYVHDPDHRHLESFAMMGDNTTAMRDPVFYRFHQYVDDIFQEHKQRLPPYTGQELGYNNIQIESVSVQQQNGTPGTLQTFWQQSDVDLSRGMDFVPRGNVFARFTHLNHSPFTYNITVNNNSGAQTMGTCRIFLAPRFDERGTEMLFRDQRLLMVEMDRFVIAMNPGPNLIRRNSTDSSITVPFDQTFRDISRNRPAPGSAAETEFLLCGCGWPQHMLVPKGIEGTGLTCQLFVMVSNFQDDRVDQDLLGNCNDASSFCGVRDRLYPDRRAMGFPFDRLSSPGADRLNQFLLPNMNVSALQIVHNNRTVQRQ